MYSIYADDVCIYNDVFLLDNMKVVDPKLVLEDSAAGSFTFTLPPSNIGYKTIVRMVTDISVRKNDEEIWAGRVLSESMDFWNNRVLTCEGELAFFNDTTQPPAEYHNLTVRGFLERLVQIHNSKVAANRRFAVGAVTVRDSNDSIYRYTNSEKTIDCINEKLVERLGGHIRVRNVNGIRYLDYLEDYPSTNTQTIEFGKNLLDFTRNWDMTEFATVIVPRGARLEESPIEALEAYLTVESVNNGSIYVQSASAVASYGWIEKVVDWDDVTTASALLAKAQKYLAEIQFESMNLELSALDLHYQNVNYEAVKLLDLIEVISRPHGMDRTFPVKKLEIPLDRPEDTKFTLGDTIRTTLTSVNNAVNSQILREIEKIPSESAILKEAVANATAIMNMAVNGYVTIARNEYGAEALYISDNKDYTKATRLWKWNLNGLAYSKDGGKTWGMAMTMDGAIVADFITAGILRGIRIISDDGGGNRAELYGARITSTSGTGSQTENAIRIYGANQTFSYAGTEYGHFCLIDDSITNQETGELRSVKELALHGTNENGVALCVYDTFGYGHRHVLLRAYKYPWESQLFPWRMEVEAEKLDVNSLDVKQNLFITSMRKILFYRDLKGTGTDNNQYDASILVGNGDYMDMFIVGRGDSAVKIGGSHSYHAMGSADATPIIEASLAWTDYKTRLQGGAKVIGDFAVSGTKSRIADTRSYEQRALYCYEMSSPMFGDIGEGKTDESGDCYIYLDGIFSETINANIEYQVFLQKEGEGDLWIQEKNALYFHVKGSPDLKFSWEIKAKQKNYEYERLEPMDKPRPGDLVSVRIAEYAMTAQQLSDSVLTHEAVYKKGIESLIKEREEFFYDETAQ